MGKWMQTSAIVLASAMVFASGIAEAGKDPKVRAAFVLLAQSGAGQTVPMARVILDGSDASCPSLEPKKGKGADLSMSPRVNPDKKNFPVTVCEALYPASGAMKIKGEKIVLPKLPKSSERVTVFGDTGCKPGDQNGCKEDSKKHWPLKRMADAAAGKPKPNLILHMGDYNYRGTPGHIQVNGEKVRVYDAGDNTPHLDCKLAGPYFGQNSVGSDSPDNWDNWWKDFFQPSAKLLQAAPWIFARGNHELCSRAGPGWFYFLDSGSDLLEGGTGQFACPSAESADPLVFHPPYRVDMGGLSVVVLDSANACDQGNLHQAHFDQQFEKIAKLVGRVPESNAIWLQMHRPLWAVKKAVDPAPQGDLDPSGQYSFIDKTLQTAYAKHPVPKQVHLVLSGHMHRFQAIGFPSSGDQQRPPQLVVGNGGVALAGNHPKNPFSFPMDGITGTGFGLSEFGYMEIELAGSGAWKGRLLDRKGDTLAKCDSALKYKTGVCKPASK